MLQSFLSLQTCIHPLSNCNKLESSLCPVATVKGAVADGFCKMMHLNILRGFEISDSTCYLKYSVVCSCRERQTFHSRAQHLKSGFIWFSILMYHAFGHLCVAMNVFYVSIALFLYLSCRNYALAYIFAWFALRSHNQLLCQTPLVHHLYNPFFLIYRRDNLHL